MAETRTYLAYARTREAYERTLQAWIRTGTSLITFGFSVYRFFQLETPPGRQLTGARTFGATLVTFGFVSLILATFQYRHQIADIRTRYPAARGPSLAVAVASALSLLGMVALLFMFIGV